MSSLQSEIRKINLDTTLSKEERNKKIQQLFLRQTSLTTRTDNLSNECSHYDKKCSQFEFDCCSVIDPCKRCHLERNDCSISRVIKITCSICNHKQVPSPRCSNCLISFSKNYCSICHLWTNVDEIYHCNECGICRIGSRDETFHCNECKMCWKKTDSNHDCLGINHVDKLCIVCHENLFKSQQNFFPLQCKHLIHNDCFQKYIQSNKYNCPQCKKSICDMTSHWNVIRQQIITTPIPNDMIQIKETNIVPSKYGKFQIQSIDTNKNRIRGYFVDWKLKNNTHPTGDLDFNTITRNIYISIYCNDCELKSKSLFHFFGLECYHCKGFNTQE